MKRPQRTKINETSLIIILIAVYLLTRLPAMVSQPLVKDEALYVLMFEEQVQSPTLVPTFLGHPVSWKPILFFWLYSLFSALPIPFEIAYRLPSLVIGLLSVPLLFQTFKRLGIGPPLAFCSCLVFIVSFASLYPNVSILTDSMMFLLILAAFNLYIREEWGEKRFVLAAFITIAAFFTKFILAVMIPALAVAYYASKDRKTIFRPLFLLSLLSIPIALYINGELFRAYGIEDSSSLALGSNTLSLDGLGGQLKRTLNAFAAILIGAGIWLALSLKGFWDNWKRHPFMSFWYCLTIFPLLAADFMIWYFLPVMPAIAFFAALCLLHHKGKEQADQFFWIVFCFLLVAMVAVLVYLYVLIGDYYGIEKKAGLFLVGKENVMVVGHYTPSVISYKMMNEMESTGRPLDVGWITAPETMEDEEVEEFARDYYSDRFPVVEGDFDQFFTSYQIFRKETKIDKFDFIAVMGTDIAIENYSLVYEDRGAYIHKRVN